MVVGLFCGDHILIIKSFQIAEKRDSVHAAHIEQRNGENPQRESVLEIPNKLWGRGRIARSAEQSVPVGPWW